MTKKLKRTLLLILTLMFIVLMVMSLIACDTYSGFTFNKNTKLDDVLSMFEDGSIQSCTLTIKSYYTARKIRSTQQFKCNASIMYYCTDDDYETWDIYDSDEEKIYTITVNKGVVDYRWSEYSLNKEESPLVTMRDMMENRANGFCVTSIKIGKTDLKINETIELKYEYNKVENIWTNFNNTEVSIPEQYSNYKEHAIEYGYH